MTAQQESEIADAVSRAVDEYLEAARQMDFEAAGEFWADTEGFVNAADGNLIASYDAWMRLIREAWDATAQFNTVEISNPQVYVLAPDAASYSMLFRLSWTLKSGETVNQHGSFMYVFKYLDGRWRVVNSAGTHLPD
jgi:ketosteroid isomerase-like protein